MHNFSWPIDGTIVGLYLLAMMIAGLKVRRYVHNVDDFIVAGRAMDLHLGIASLAATEFGIVTCMYAAQNGYEKGFAGATPGILMATAMYVVGATGFCIEPLRAAGVSTNHCLLGLVFDNHPLRCGEGGVGHRRHAEKSGAAWRRQQTTLVSVAVLLRCNVSRLR